MLIAVSFWAVKNLVLVHILVRKTWIRAHWRWGIWTLWNLLFSLWLCAIVLYFKECVIYMMAWYNIHLSSIYQCLAVLHTLCHVCMRSGKQQYLEPCLLLVWICWCVSSSKMWCDTFWQSHLLYILLYPYSTFRAALKARVENGGYR